MTTEPECRCKLTIPNPTLLHDPWCAWKLAQSKPKELTLKNITRRSFEESFSVPKPIWKVGLDGTEFCGSCMDDRATHGSQGCMICPCSVKD